MTNDQRTDARKILKHFGLDAQTDKMHEEDKEFNEALYALEVDPTTENALNVIFEAGDKLLMTFQVMYGAIAESGVELKPCDIDTALHNSINSKIKRTFDRIDSRYYEGEK